MAPTITDRERNIRSTTNPSMDFGNTKTPLIRDEAHLTLLDHSGREFGYDPFATEADNADALAKWRSWIERSSP